MAQLGEAPEALVPFLLTALRDPNLVVRTRAAESLGEIGDPAAVTPLIERLGDRAEVRDVRTRAAEALGRLDRRLRSQRCWRFWTIPSGISVTTRSSPWVRSGIGRHKTAWPMRFATIRTNSIAKPPNAHCNGCPATSKNGPESTDAA